MTAAVWQRNSPLQIKRAEARPSGNLSANSLTARRLSLEPHIPVPETQSVFIGAHNETLSVAISVNNPDCSPFKV